MAAGLLPFLLLLFVVGTRAAWFSSLTSGTSAPSESRLKVYDCFMKLADFDHNGCVTPQELQRLFSVTLGKREAGLMWSVSQVFNRCQPKRQQDLCITRQDLNATLLSPDPTCLPRFTHVAAFQNWVCDRYLQIRRTQDV